MGSPKMKAEDVEAVAKWLEIKLKPGMMLDRIGRIDPLVLSYVRVLTDDALMWAEVAEKEIPGGKYRGPLHGIPIAIKDIYDIKGVKTTACSKVCENYVPDQDCTVVRKFREAGAVILGKVTGALHWPQDAGSHAARGNDSSTARYQHIGMLPSDAYC